MAERIYKPFTISMIPEEIEELKQYAKLWQMPVSQFVRMVIKEWKKMDDLED